MKTTVQRSACILVVLGACSFAACSAEAPTGEDVGSTADGLSKAAFTTFVDEEQCLHGSGNGINCNHYASKQGVYMNGGPTGNVLPDGEYYFVVIEPGHQNGGFLDGAEGNLSDTTPVDGDGDLIPNRTFTMSGGQVMYGGGHDQSGATPNGKNAVGLYPFDDTSNNGGVYILAICEVGATSPRQCKYDMFKVTEPEPYCGDDHIDEGEDCDGTDLGECTYGCTADCTCEEPPPPPPCCGDDHIDAGEDCDGTDLGECAYGCTADCTCEEPPPPPPCCGDGVVDEGEQCDGGANTECPYGCGSDCTCEVCVDPGTSCTSDEDCGVGYACDPYACECVCPENVPVPQVD